ncbi:MAG: hypothetical protein GEU94_09320 [Micromonosporaceae bacterium]|nr:hypothetical protein [Micromonosporaceae bacterium]
MGMAHRRPREHEYLLAGMLRHAVCGRVMSPAAGPGGSRIYACRAGCPWVLVAAPLERKLLLRALVRAYAALYRIGRRGPMVFDGLAPEPRTPDDGVAVSVEEARRWQQCAPLNRRGMLRVAFLRVDIDEHGQARPVWRHRTDGGGRPGGDGRRRPS